jgi:hypothetical protein
MAIELRGWSIDLPSRHCAHASGLQAYFDPTLTASGALRVVGPFGTSAQNEAEVRHAMLDLTAALEALPVFHEAYVLWGAYLEEPPACPEHQILVLGVNSGFVPHPALRTALMLDANEQRLNPAREWSLDIGLMHAHHRSGLSFAIEAPRRSRALAAWLPSCHQIRISTPDGMLDASCLDEDTAADMLGVMGELAWQLLNGRAPHPVRDRFQFRDEINAQQLLQNSLAGLT